MNSPAKHAAICRGLGRVLAIRHIKDNEDRLDAMEEAQLYQEYLDYCRDYESFIPKPLEYLDWKVQFDTLTARNRPFKGN